MFRLQILNSISPPHRWRTIAESDDGFLLSRRARNLVKLWNLRPQDGHRAARVIDKDGEEACYFEIGRRSRKSA